MNFKILIRNTFTIFGVFSLSVFIILGIYILFFSNSSLNPQINKATISDVRFVLNWCELGDEKIDSVLKSYVSGRSFSGDHHDSYLIKIKNFDISELEKTETGKWYRGDELPQILDDAVKFSNGFQYETPWFIKESEIRTSEIYIYPWSIYCSGINPSSVQLIILNPKKNLVYYISASI